MGDWADVSPQSAAGSCGAMSALSAPACDTLRRVASTVDDLVVALSELYLDTDVRDALPRLAQRIVGCGLPRSHIERLWRRQITPAVHWNLRSPAGEWAGFDRHWLLAEVSRRRERPGLVAWPLIGRFVHRLQAFGAEPEYRVAWWLAERLRSVPESKRARRVAGWQALLAVYYSVDGELAAPYTDAEHIRGPAQRSADVLVRRHDLDPSELSDEFRAICDALAPLLSREPLATAAESHVAAWLDRLSQPKH